jgi:TM2 domain-containing membrane protein YozV
VAYCRTCGKALCQTCQRTAFGTVFCAEHLPAQAPPPPPAPAAVAGAPKPSASPGLAFVLGLIPGVGAIYNGQYAKGVMHVIILGVLISILSSGAGDFAPLFGALTAVWYFYMPFEAYHTARRRQLGEVVDEFSSLVPLRPHRPGFPLGPVLIIALGVLFLLNTMDILRLHQIVRYWPVFLIVLGVYMLYCRLTGCDNEAADGPEARHGQ